MFIPIGDENPREGTPYVNYTLLGLNVIAFIMFCMTDQQLEASIFSGAMVPAWLIDDFGSYWYTLFTCMFMHAGFMHIIGNMLFLWIFGDNVEDQLGHVGYAIFYFVCGLSASGLHILGAMSGLVEGVTDPTYFIDNEMAVPMAYIPTLGASGAISGVIAAYAMFFPRHRVRCLIWIYFFITVIHIEAFWWVGIWLVISNILPMLYSSGEGGGVAYLAHIGGFLGGIGIAAAVRFLVLPGRLSGPAPTQSQAVPSEIRVASRPSRRTYFQQEPLITKVQEAPRPTPGITIIDDKSDQTYSVLRNTDQLTHIGKIATIASSVTGEVTNEVIRRLTNTRGIIARNVTGGQADRIRHELHLVGIEALVIPMTSTYMLPTPIIVSQFSWNDMSMRYWSGEDSRSIPWETPILYIGAKVAGESIVDVFLSTRIRIRIRRSIPLKRVDMRTRSEVVAGMHDLGQAILRLRRTGSINEGIRVLAHRGSWGWLAFTSEQDFEDHTFWAYNMVLSSFPLID